MVLTIGNHNPDWNYVKCKLYSLFTMPIEFTEHLICKYVCKFSSNLNKNQSLNTSKCFTFHSLYHYKNFNNELQWNENKFSGLQMLSLHYGQDTFAEFVIFFGALLFEKASFCFQVSKSQAFLLKIYQCLTVQTNHQCFLQYLPKAVCQR